MPAGMNTQTEIDGPRPELAALAAAWGVPDPDGQGSLVARCVSGDSSAWRALHQQFRPIVAAFLRKLGVAEGELEDACQDVFLQTFRYLPSFQGRAQLKTWLYRLCITEARTARRRRHQADATRALYEQELAVRPAVSGSAMSDGVARRKLGAAMAALPQGERFVFALFEMKGVGGREIAQIAGCPVATVWRRLHDARQTFRAAIEESPT